MLMHPADELRGIKNSRLSNKKIVLGVTGSIAAVECIKIARELIRHGAEVIPVMTHAATKIIHPDALWFATGKKPIIQLTGKTEHVFYCGRVKDPIDLLLISPCTANTISKIAHGIDDTPVTTFATTAIGSGIPILIVPAMHISIYDHKIIQENIEKCKRVGIKFIEPKIMENKAKLAETDEIVDHVLRTMGNNDLSGKKILVIGGATAEAIDDVRVITNKSSGKTALSLAKNAFYRGADVEMWSGWKCEQVPVYTRNESFTSIENLIELLDERGLKDFDVIINCAAIADYKPKKQNGKVSSGNKKLVLELELTEKIISKLRSLAPKSKIIGFKVEESKDSVKTKSLELLNKNKLDFVVGNTTSGFGTDENEIWVFDSKGSIIHKNGTKDYLADCILDLIKE